MISSKSIVVDNIEIGGLERVKRSSGFPKEWNPTPNEERVVRLAKAPVGSGHDCCLKGIVVWHEITADHSFWLQWQLYHFHEIVSSTSKMHSLTDMELVWHPQVGSEMEIVARRYLNLFSVGLIDFETLVVNMPIGLMLKADTLSSYLQLKTIYHQRKNHKMSSWREYCKWIEGLPLMDKIL